LLLIDADDVDLAEEAGRFLHAGFQLLLDAWVDREFFGDAGHVVDFRQGVEVTVKGDSGFFTHDLSSVC
jgi:hypothetical protein